PSVTRVATILKPVSRALTAVSPMTFTSLARMFCHVRPSTESTNFTISMKSNDLGIHAGKRSGEPVDECRFEVNADSVTELLEAQLAGADQVANERNRILQYGFDRAAGLFQIRHGTGRDDRENDLEQVPDRVAGPTDELDGKR